VLKDMRQVFQRQVGQMLAQIKTQFKAVYQTDMRVVRKLRKS